MRWGFRGSRRPVELPHGKVLTVRAEGLKEHRHLPVILFNGKKLDAPFIDIRDLMKGPVFGEL